MFDPARPLPLLDLRSHHCRWPVDGSGRCDCAPSGPFGAARGQLFCGAQSVTGKPYCAEHMARASGAGTKAERDAIRFARDQDKRETMPAGERPAASYQGWHTGSPPVSARARNLRAGQKRVTSGEA